MDRLDSSSDALRDRLSQISTLWTALVQAHAGTPSAIHAAQQRLFERYSGAVYRYLRAALRNDEAAQDLFQDFALRLIRGDFKNADPQRGRFRQFLKTVLCNLVIDYRRRQQKQPLALTVDIPMPVAETDPAQDDDAFRTAWQEDLLSRTWDELDLEEQRVGKPICLVLRYRADHPGMRSAQMAEQLGQRLGKPVSAGWVRRRLFEARQKFAQLLLGEVVHLLGLPTAEELAEELIDLGLYEYCRPALEQRQGKGGTAR